MRKSALIAIAIILFATAIGTALAYANYDPIKFKTTNGYDPKFLQASKVKLSCSQSHEDMQRVGLPDLGYCKKELGTL